MDSIYEKKFGAFESITETQVREEGKTHRYKKEFFEGASKMKPGRSPTVELQYDDMSTAEIYQLAKCQEVSVQASRYEVVRRLILRNLEADKYELQHRKARGAFIDINDEIAASELKQFCDRRTMLLSQLRKAMHENRVKVDDGIHLINLEYGTLLDECCEGFNLEENVGGNNSMVVALRGRNPLRAQADKKNGDRDGEKISSST